MNNQRACLPLIETDRSSGAIFRFGAFCPNAKILFIYELVGVAPSFELGQEFRTECGKDLWAQKRKMRLVANRRDGQALRDVVVGDLTSEVRRYVRRFQRLDRMTSGD